jgi:hypothetical protein
MILLHRVTPFVIALACAAGFFAVIRLGVNPLVGIAGTLMLASLLFARLCEWRVRTFQFWFLVGTPLMFLVSSFGFLLLLEVSWQRVLLACVTVVLVGVFAELVFAYVHAPAHYQAYTIEHLSLALYVLAMYFLSALFFGTRMLLELPLAGLCAFFALGVMFMVYGTLWVSKMAPRPAIAYALAGTVLATELFAVITYLPTGYYTDAALLALYLYLFLGLTRAQLAEKLSRPVVRRYAVTGAVLLVIIVGTAHWT